MNRFLSICGAAALVVAVIAAGALGLQAWNGHELAVESKAFVDEAVPAITAHWDRQALVDRALPATRQSFTTGSNAANFDSYAQFGSLVEYEGASGDVRKPALFVRGFEPSATYKAKARFENGEAIVHLFLTKRDGAWRIIFFRVENGPRRVPLPRS